MPKPKSSAENRVNELRKMSGTDFALEVTKDLVMLQAGERGKALKLLSALNETINRESAALSS